jgi:Acetyltransferase (GNAT) family
MDDKNDDERDAPRRGGVRVRLAETQADVEAYVGLARLLHGESEYRHLQFDHESIRRIGQHYLTRPNHMCLFLAERDGEIIGMLRAVISSLSYVVGGRIASALEFYVTPYARGGAAALRLLRMLQRWAHAHQALSVNLYVTSGIRMKQTDSFLRKAGFHFTGGNYSAPASAVPEKNRD